MCFYIICSIHLRATQVSQCIFYDPSVRLQEQRGRNDIFPKLSHFQTVLCCLRHELCLARNPILWRAGRGRSSPSWSLKLLNQRWSEHLSHLPCQVLFCLVASLKLLPVAEVMDVVLQPLGSSVQGNKGALAVVCMSMQVGNNTQEGVLRLNTLQKYEIILLEWLIPWLKVVTIPWRLQKQGQWVTLK